MRQEEGLLEPEASVEPELCRELPSTELYMDCGDCRRIACMYRTRKTSAWPLQSGGKQPRAEGKWDLGPAVFQEAVFRKQGGAGGCLLPCILCLFFSFKVATQSDLYSFL